MSSRVLISLHIDLKNSNHVVQKG